jgi:molybdenum cofactor cytidylyltransferase
MSGSTTLVFPTLAAVLLAAGSSRRYGHANKLLADIGGTPLLARVASALVQTGFAEIVVVTGHDADSVQRALASFAARLRFVHNPNHANGMGGSVATGIAALVPGIAGAVVAQGDMPAVDAALLGTLGRRFVDAGSDRITVPWLSEGRHGNPVIWPRRLFPDLRSLTGDQGGKGLIKAAGDGIERVAVNNTAATIDIDTPEQLAAYSRNITGH